MLKTSLGYHTISVFQRLTAEEYFSLGCSFLSPKKGMEKFKIETKKGEIGWVYTHKRNRGIRWITTSFAINDRITIHGVKAVITPKVLLNKDYITASNEKDIESFKALFNAEATRISPILRNIESYSMSRCDYCLNFDLKELKIPCTSEKMMTLIKRGNVPKYFFEMTKYDKTSHRKKTDKNSFYLESGSVTVNCYDKYAQLMNDENHPCPNKEDSEGIIRFEVQCKYRKLYSMSKNNARILSEISDASKRELAELYDDLMCRRRPTTIPMDIILSDDISTEEITKYFYKVIRKGDYYTLEKAKRKIQLEHCRQKKKDRLISALTLINQCRGINKAKSILQGKELESFKRSLKDLDTLRINPVTIPREWNVEFIPNLLNAYYNMLAVEHEKELVEQCSREILKDYINDCRKKRKKKR